MKDECVYPDFTGGMTYGKHNYGKDGDCIICGKTKEKAKCPLGHDFNYSKKGFENKPLYYCTICKYWIHVDEYNLQKEYYDKERTK